MGDLKELFFNWIHLGARIALGNFFLTLAGYCLKAKAIKITYNRRKTNGGRNR